MGGHLFRATSKWKVVLEGVEDSYCTWKGAYAPVKRSEREGAGWVGGKLEVLSV